jgi:eukaryotic-like serine/threonine-protein kinase
MIGETLGSYRIVSEIGSGGMGVVYLAEHTLLGRKAAVKLLRREVAADQVERFFTEARAAATLHHPGLVEVFDFGHHTDGSAYIVMEYLHGESLAERLEHAPRLPFFLAGHITRQVANALHVAHEQGIVHRDLKPGNIFLIAEPDAPAGVRAKVLDFGIAKLMRDDAPRSVKTHSGAVIGTPRYMSPEQCRNARKVDGRSDIYALGCILYEMLLGVAPFDYDSWAELVAAHLHEAPPRPRELDPAMPVEVEALIVRMLEKRAEDRYQSMHELAQSLEELLRGHAIEHGLPMSTPPTGIARITPPGGIRPRATGSDPTLPASRERRRAGTDPTLPASAERVPERVPAARSSRWLIAIAGVLLVGGIGVVTVVLGKDTAAEPEPTFIVVDQRGGPVPDVEPRPEPITVPALSADAGVEATSSADAGTPRPTRPASEPDVDQLTRVFGRRRAQVATCFTRHPAQVRDGIEVRIQLDVTGRVRSAEVLPPSVGTTPLGECLASVARDTAFGPQPKPITFRVPIHASAERGN